MYKNLFRFTAMIALFILILSPSALCQYSGGVGKDNDPYKIGNVSDWQHLMSTPADWSRYFILTADLDLASITVTPIGNSTTRFTGTFDGNDHTISNVSINLPATDYIGLFGYIQGYQTTGLIKNLNLENVSINGYSYVGGLLGYNMGGKILNCHAQGTVKGKISVGGLIGYTNQYNNVNCKIDCCSSSGYVVSLYSPSNPIPSIGGLIGYNIKTPVTNSFASAAVDGGTYNFNVGGLIGLNGISSSAQGGNVTNCFSTGSVIGKSSNGACFGGLIGSNYNANISNCYSKSSVNCSLSSSHYMARIGGLIGQNISGNIDFSYASGSVYGEGYIGGLVGYLQNNNSGNIPYSNINSCYASGSVSGYGALGGLVGYVYYNSNPISISSSFATGNVNGTSLSYSSGALGGLIGSQQHKYATIENCFASGSVTGDYYTGGLIGDNAGYIKKSFSTGLVTGSVNYAGGFIGHNFYPDYITFSFWDTQTSGKTVAFNPPNQTSTGVVGKTTFQMKSPLTFTSANWHFSNAWLLTENKYPALKWTQNQLVIGSGDLQWQFPLAAYYCNARTQSIYLASQIGKSASITSLSLEIAKPPKNTLNNFTIRMKHTSLNAYLLSPKPAWDSNDWQTVYCSDQNISNVGWVEFKLDTPFDYNSAQNLMVDFSFDNNSWSDDALCFSSAPGGFRTLTACNDGEFGSPLDWTSRIPVPYSSENVPNIKLSLYDEKKLTPDFNGDLTVNAKDFAYFAGNWNKTGSLPDWANNCDLDKSGSVDFNDLAILSDNWLIDPVNITWVPVDENELSFISKYEITNSQYCTFLNQALLSGNLKVDATSVTGPSMFDTGQETTYYTLNGAGSNSDGVVNGGASRIKFQNDTFTVDPNFENHPVTYVTLSGATAFCNYYRLQMPSLDQWQSAADFDGSYTYGCGSAIDNSIANYMGSVHPFGTTPVGSFGTFGYGLADMAGNVAEWTTSQVYCDGRPIICGGDWLATGQECISIVTFPYFYYHFYDGYNIGFRPCILKK